MALVYASTYARVFAFRVFTHDDPYKVVDGAALERCVDAGKNAGGTHIGVLIEALTDFQAQAPQRDVIGDIRIARRAEKNGVFVAQDVQPVFRHNDPVLAAVITDPNENFDIESKK